MKKLTMAQKQISLFIKMCLIQNKVYANFLSMQMWRWKTYGFMRNWNGRIFNLVYQKQQ